MKLTFHIHYITQWSQQLFVSGSLPELGNGLPKEALALQHTGNGQWTGSVVLKNIPEYLDYQYLLLNDHGGTLNEDWGRRRRIRFVTNEPGVVILKDTWRSKFHENNSLYTSAFTDVIFKQVKDPAQINLEEESNIIFQIHAPRIETKHQICLCGSIPELGNWDLSNPVLLSNQTYPLWSKELKIDTSANIEYKFGIYDRQRNKVISLESGPNRNIKFKPTIAQRRFVITDEYFNLWKNNWKGAGVAIPVFSLRSKKGFGVGEFKDLIKLVDWSCSAGLKMIQILPINDTSATGSWLDSYPYAAISVFALHPLYLRIEDIYGFKVHIGQKKYKAKRKQLNALKDVDFEEVMQLKLHYARIIFKQQKEVFLQNPSFQSFLKENAKWLKPYALFCYLRDVNDTADFSKWKAGKKFSKSTLTRMTADKSPHFKQIAFYYFLQYYLDKQLGEAASYAKQNGVVMKGDIPIGIYRYSVEAWTNPELYNMASQSGAPPDPFSEIGQNWGFPTYNWDEMAKDGYTWWQERLKQLSRYFDAFRIDHILGFFRIWQIPYDQIEGLMGQFNPALPVHRDEFRELGIPFNKERYCLPFITDKVLDDVFGKQKDTVIKTFLQSSQAGSYAFKKAFNTQRKIDIYLDLKKNADLAPLKKGLFSLINNVLFFEVSGSKGTLFHPRIDFTKISSYKNLDFDTQKSLHELYIDYFYRRQENFWRKEAMAKLPSLKKATNMLICGEDLGMVPACVPEVMKELGLLSLEIQRMSKNPKTEFLQAADIPYESVCSPSTHDMSPIRLWWEESERDQIQRFYNQDLGFEGDAPIQCDSTISEAIIRQIISWPSMWSVFPIQDLLGLSDDLKRDDASTERINVPGNPLNYWRYRVHLTLETLVKNQEFIEKIHKMLAEYDRV